MVAARPAVEGRRPRSHPGWFKAYQRIRPGVSSSTERGPQPPSSRDREPVLHAAPIPKATSVNNEGAFPPADARTYCPEEGSDSRNVDATSNRKRCWARSIEIH